MKNSKTAATEIGDYELKKGEMILSVEEVEKKFQETKAARIRRVEQTEKELEDEVGAAFDKYLASPKGRRIKDVDLDFSDVEDEMEFAQ